MADTLQIDLLDVVAAVVGAVFGMFLAASLVDLQSDYADLLIGGPAFAALCIKRVFVPTRPLAPGSGPLARMLYLLAAIAGALCAVGAVLLAWSTLDSGAEAAWEAARTPALAGGALLFAAACVDQVFLQRSSSGD